jgi:uncharacterized DUF497 family protein
VPDKKDGPNRRLLMKSMDGEPVSLSIGTRPDGIPEVTSKNGIKFGGMQIKAIGIENLLHLARITFSKVEERTMIIGSFKDGGAFEIVYTDSGKIEGLTGTDIMTKISTIDPKGNVLTLLMKAAQASQAY